MDTAFRQLDVCRVQRRKPMKTHENMEDKPLQIDASLAALT
jgi:hypothetical protein